MWVLRAMLQHHSDTLLWAGLALGFSRLLVIKKWPGLALVHSTAACNVIAHWVKTEENCRNLPQVFLFTSAKSSVIILL